MISFGNLWGGSLNVASLLFLPNLLLFGSEEIDRHTIGVDGNIAPGYDVVLETGGYDPVEMMGNYCFQEKAFGVNFCKSLDRICVENNPVLARNKKKRLKSTYALSNIFDKNATRDMSTKNHS